MHGEQVNGQQRSTLAFKQRTNQTLFYCRNKSHKYKKCHRLDILKSKRETILLFKRMSDTEQTIFFALIRLTS